MRHLCCFFIVLTALAVHATTRNNIDVDAVLNSTDRNDGLCVLVNTSDPTLAIGIARKSKFALHVIHTNTDTVVTLRKAIDKQGLYGRILVSKFNGTTLPYAENLVNLIINVSAAISHKELQRVLAPYGTLYNNGKATVKPYPAEFDEWSHFRHNAEGNMVSQDTEVAAPRHVRWVANPSFQRSHALTPTPTTLVGAGGRLFYIEDETPIGFAGLPDQWRLIARDAFNGKRLWSRDIKIWGDSAWSWHNGSHVARFNHPKHVTKRLVVYKDLVFVTLGFNAPVSVIDAATGKTIREYSGTEYADEILFRDEVLYVSVNDRRQGPLPGKGFSSEPTGENISKKMIWAINAKSGDILWKAGPYTGITEKKNRMSSMRSLLLVASEKGIFGVIDHKTVVGIDHKTGKERFQTSADIYSSEGALFYHKGTLIIGEKKKLTAINADNGKLKWTANTPLTKHDIPAVFGIGDFIWTQNAEAMKAIAWNIDTGKVAKTLSMIEVYSNANHHPRCYPGKSTVNYMLSSRRALETLNYKTGEVTVNHWARAGCRLGYIPANGLLYKTPDPCLCHLTAKLSYFYALAGENTTDFQKHPVSRDRLEKGSAFGNISKGKTNPESDWPQFRHDVQRSSSVKTTIPKGVEIIWYVKMSGTLTPPVIAGGAVYVSAVDESKVYAFDEQSGRQLWSYPVGGNVDSPPSIYNGMVIFGAADGYVYCLRASDGELAWRFRAAPYERNIMAFNRVESAWPVHGSVLIANGVVYCSAGRSSFVDGGIFLFALDAATGTVLGEKVIHHVQEHNGTGKREDSRKMPAHAPGAPSNILVTDGSRIFSRMTELDFGVPLKKGPNDYMFSSTEVLIVPSTFSDQLWFHKVQWSYGKKINGNMIAFDEKSVYSLYQFEKKGPAQRKLFVPKGGDQSMIPDKDRYTSEETGIRHLGEIDGGGVLLSKTGVEEWKISEFPVGSFSMVVTENMLLVAGFIIEIDPKDPWGKIEGRKGSVLWMLSKQNGGKLSELSLETLPVWNGMAAANNKIFISLKNGKLICMGKCLSKKIFDFF